MIFAWAIFEAGEVMRVVFTDDTMPVFARRVRAVAAMKQLKAKLPSARLSVQKISILPAFKEWK